MKIVIATRSSYQHGPTPQRMDLFRHVTLPAVIAQTDQDFEWLIHVSTREHGEWIESLLPADTQFRLTMRTELDFTAHGEDVRMARLDDDDAISKDYVERLRAAGDHTPGRWWIFPNGYRTYCGRCQPYNNPTNQFIALDIPNGSRQTVYAINHSTVREQLDFRDVDDRPAWLFVRHNESKSPGGRQPCRQPIDNLKSFAIAHDFLRGLR